jgi:hypothetical protein
MADPLTRLADQIDAAIPQLAMFAVARWACAIVLSPSLRITSRFFPQFSDELRLVVDKTYYTIHAFGVVLYAFVLTFFLHDAWKNYDDLTTCSQHSIPRPLGIATGVGLVGFFFTTRLSVSSTCVVVMLCAKEKSILTGLAAICAWGIWAHSTSAIPLLVVAFVVAGTHGSVCVSPSSAALCVCCFCWLCAWTWAGLLRSCYTRSRKLLKLE